MPDTLPIQTTSNSLVLLALYVGAALAVALYVYTTFIAPRRRDAARPDYDAKTRDLFQRYRADERQRGPDYLLPGEHLAPDEHGDDARTSTG